MWHVGQPIVCVEGWEHAREFYENFPGGIYKGIVYPQKDAVYHIRSIEDRQDGIFFRLMEIVNPDMDFMGGVRECTFDSQTFRPLVEKKTDISIFTRIPDMLFSKEPALQ